MPNILFTLLLSLFTISCSEKIEESQQLQPETSKLQKAETNETVGEHYIPDALWRRYLEERRFALVIGNNSYEELEPLHNAVNDSKKIGESLEKFGFEITYIQNGGRSQITQYIQYFSEILQSGGVGVIFYAGHGLEVEGENYLIPVDAKIRNELDIKREGISLDDILSRLERANNRLNIVILDACRNNPFKDFPTRSLGLAPIRLPVERTFIAYSAGVGEEVFDGDGENSLFTKYLLKNLEREAISLNRVFQLTKEDVLRETNGEQNPTIYNKVAGNFFFSLPKR
jgi:uncharacterized caspase-like protein